ncbi:hypothetical protein ESA94_01225 [Lacibacter luteus]|uniref:Pectate lyase superfamily protein domain-containing protein n=1 Tax=Lacibacter luteus TaxID=2508719 RepID=A0A4Q1CL06_9BACT|nr:hypothetical protein [Lacibacter luteus]RXK61667.1 hypothetical protein ESA94_01225 [Lacibacter luteus]
MSRISFQKTIFILSAIVVLSFQSHTDKWVSKFIKLNKNGSLEYIPDEKGNIIPDFSRVGYYSGDKNIPEIPVVKTISATGSDNDETVIQQAIDEVAKLPLKKDGFRGAILLKKGSYIIPNSIRIKASGIVLRGEGDDTKLLSTSKKQVAVVDVSGDGTITEVKGSRTKIINEYVPTGSFTFSVSSTKSFSVGDKIIVLRPGTNQWIKDLKMDQIEDRGGTRQWQPKEYDLEFERVITKIEGNKISIDNPIVMPMEQKYGGAEIYKYSFANRINHVGIEHLSFESSFETDTSENHAWDAIKMNKIENSWVRNVTAKHFGFSCVNLGALAKSISVLNSKCFDHKSVITGSRRYSFSNNGQLNLFMNCQTSDGRHDYVTGARTNGPNVFYNCTSTKTHADIGPHHRWSTGTLYDNIVTDGEINIQDRGNWGSGHGWVGVTQVVWNCTVKRAAVQNPWVSGNNYCIGLKGEKYDGRLKGRPDALWEGQNKDGLQPTSLYMAQLNARKK